MVQHVPLVVIWDAGEIEGPVVPGRTEKQAVIAVLTTWQKPGVLWLPRPSWLRQFHMN